MSVACELVIEIALALLTTISTPPNVAKVLSRAARTCASSRTSTVRGSALPPAFSISFAAEKIVPGSLGLGSAVLAAMATLAPSRAAPRPIASPMPREAPVMNSVLPESVEAEAIVLPQICNGCPSAASTDSWKASLIVGWARIVKASQKATRGSGHARAGSVDHENDTVVGPRDDSHEVLVAVHDVSVSVENRPRPQCRGVRTRTELGEAVACNAVRRRQVLHDLLTKPPRAKCVDHPDGHVVDREKRRDPRAPGR